MKGASAHRFWAFLLVTAQAVMLGAMSGLWSFPVFLCLIAFLGLPGWKQFVFSHRTRQILGLLLGAAFLAKSQMIPVELYPLSGRGLPFGYSYAIAQMCLSLQVAQFFLKSPNDRFPFFLSPLGCIVMAFAGNLREAAGILSNAETHAIYRVIIFSYILILACYLSDIGRWRRGASSLKYDVLRLVAFCACLCFVCTLAWGASAMVPRAEQAAVGILSRMQLQGAQTRMTPGFSSISSLGSISYWKSNKESRPALRIVSDAAPGYMRAQVYTTCLASEWTNTMAKVSLLPRSTVPKGLPNTGFGEELFEIRLTMRWLGEAREQEWREMTVRHCGGPCTEVYGPLGTEYIMATSRLMSVDNTGMVESAEIMQDGAYRIFLPTEPEYNSLSGGAAITQNLRDKCLQLPPGLSSEVKALAVRVLAGAYTPMEKMVAVEKYFRSTYLYKLGIQVPEGQDPLTYFLLEKPAAHCEYFASGAALLLRLGGVPCRYVGGFLTGERNNWGGYWVARNKDAHAWVEAYDEVLGWKVVEATPSRGVPHSEGVSSASFLSQIWDVLKDRAMRLKNAFLGGGIKRVLMNLFALSFAALHWLIIQPVVILVVLFLAACYLYYRFYVRRRASEAANAIDPGVLAMQSLLDEMDRRLERVGVVRSKAETLHQFSRRLAAEPEETNASFRRDAASWYARYGDARYGLSDLSGAADSLRVIMPQEDTSSAL